MSGMQQSLLGTMGLPDALPKTPARSARDTRSGTDRTSNFSIAQWRCAPMCLGSAQRAGDLCVGLGANDKFRASDNSVDCPRSGSSTKRLINSPIESRENHNGRAVFSDSQEAVINESFYWSGARVALLTTIDANQCEWRWCSAFSLSRTTPASRCL